MSVKGEDIRQAKKFLENKNIPHGFPVLSKYFSSVVNLVPFIPKIIAFRIINSLSD